MQPLLIPRNEDYKLQNIVATQLNSQGFNEMMANSLTTATYVQLSTMLKEEHNVTMLNPLVTTYRHSTVTTVLRFRAISYNINRKTLI
jgi:phenylalanyl-tRNA synthetase beta chain